MKYLRKITILLTLLHCYVIVAAQSDTTFKPSGKPVFLIFSNVHSSFADGEVSPAFELTRFYLGYEYAFSPKFSTRATLDIGNPGAGNLQMTAFVKLAYLQYQSNGFTGRIGMITTDAFSLIDRHWGYRYVARTLQDEYGMNPSADLGLSLEYSPADFISIDVSSLNGEGFRRIQSDDALKYTVGVTLKPVENLIVRGYSDFIRKEFTQNTVSFFVGYTAGGFRTGIEYATQGNYRFTEGNDLSAVSVFATQAVAEKFSIMARYDRLWSNDDPVTGEPWNSDSNGQLFMGGIEYSPLKGIKVAPVYRGWLPEDGSPLLSSVGLYFEIRL